MRLLLLSNSTNFGGGYLDHAMDEIRGFFGPAKRVAFVPFALFDQDGYTAKARQRLRAEGIEVTGVTPDAAGHRLLESAEGVFVGGGNTFRLLLKLQVSGLLADLRNRVLQGLPYLGASAGTNIAAPSIKTTNDMPIVQPESFEALGLLPFQINPHYLDPDPASAHMGGTREGGAGGGGGGGAGGGGAGHGRAGGGRPQRPPPLPPRRRTRRTPRRRF